MAEIRRTWSLRESGAQRGGPTISTAAVRMTGLQTDAPALAPAPPATNKNAPSMILVLARPNPVSSSHRDRCATRWSQKIGRSARTVISFLTIRFVSWLGVITMTPGENRLVDRRLALPLPFRPRPGVRQLACPKEADCEFNIYRFDIFIVKMLFCGAISAKARHRWRRSRRRMRLRG